MRISINYRTEGNQSIFVTGNISALGNWNELSAIQMIKISGSEWELELDVVDTELQYHYLVKEDNEVIRQEWGNPHKIYIDSKKTYYIKDFWQDFPVQHHLYTSAFTEVFFAHKIQSQTKCYDSTYILIVDCPFVQKGQVLKISGETSLLGEWDTNKALSLEYAGNTTWQLSFDKMQIGEGLEYRLIICEESSGEVLHSNEDGNQFIKSISAAYKLQIDHQSYRHSGIQWYGAGVSIPVFSLRSSQSWGIGEFSDLKKLIKWASATGQQIIQLLPINDTSASFLWGDSYPYNTISIYALHPVYLGLSEFSLKDKKLQEKFQQKGKELNMLESLDYVDVIKLKSEFLKILYKEIGEEVLEGNDFRQFYFRNKEWLFPYACFCYFRDVYGTTNFSTWSDHGIYNSEKLELLFTKDKAAKDSIQLTYFVQFLLHNQLAEVKEYAHQHNIILKGDIPIGVNRYSVETWVEPHLFHLDMQAGAPPDVFAVYGQNWGFPTYNWEEMAKDNYHWWKKRFAKMSDYFDAYRIDHILGFFRIWEIPKTSIQGLLGHFNPAYPLSPEEIIQYGIVFDSQKMTHPHIHSSFLEELFESYSREVTYTYLHENENGFYEPNENCNTQEKINYLFRDKGDEKSMDIRDRLFRLCNEVLFIEDPSKEGEYHPRISAKTTFAYQQLNDNEKESFKRLYDEFYYHRHNEFWKQEALKKLPELLSATAMLPCGEDLGMIPASVPEVMRQLQILSLEIERWPKENRMFSDLSKLPYLSVCTTSTHDMSPIRAWWHEEPENTQQYYTDILKREGKAPEECTPDICKQIVFNHLSSSSILTIIPLQDWMSIDGKLRKPDGDSERINIPSDPSHNWQYRMHLTLEKLIDADEFNKSIKELIRTGRGHLS